MKFDDYVNGILNERSGSNLTTADSMKQQETARKLAASKAYYSSPEYLKYAQSKYGPDVDLGMPGLANIEKDISRDMEAMVTYNKMMKPFKRAEKAGTLTDPMDMNRYGQLKSKYAILKQRRMDNIALKRQHPSYIAKQINRGKYVPLPADIEQQTPDVAPKFAAAVAPAGQGTKTIAPIQPTTEPQAAGLSKYALPAAAAVGGLYVGKKALDWVTGKKKKKKKNNEV